VGVEARVSVTLLAPDGDAVLVLVTIGLVLVATAALVIGFASNQMGPVELSILCSCVAAVVLFFYSRLNQRRGAVVTTATGPVPLPTPAD
jgi:uncharacterized membrane protein